MVRLQVKGTLLREPLAEVLQFGKLGCSDHVWQCPGHKWQPNITLTDPRTGTVHPVQFMDEAPSALRLAKCTVPMACPGQPIQLLCRRVKFHATLP